MTQKPVNTTEPVPEWEKYGLVRFRSLSEVGLLLASLFFLASLMPSLSARLPFIQGVASGVITGVGYELGLGLVWLVRALQFVVPKENRKTLPKWVVLLAATVIVTYALLHADGWTNATRKVSGLPDLDGGLIFAIISTAAAVFAAVWVLARLFWMAVSRIDRQISRVVPPRVALVSGILAGGLLFWSLIEGTAVRFAIQAVDKAQEAADHFVDPDIPRPVQAVRTGSDKSLLEWDELGRQGRAFVASAPTKAEIEELTGAPAMDPIRVYVGRRSAETYQERADLALAELIRVGAFDRSVLVVASPTGTGWMDPNSHDPLDIMLGGDVATVGVQFSYLSSPLALVLHPELGLEQTEAVFDTIYKYWTNLPKDTRPKFYVFGLSQGAFNTQSTVRWLDMLSDPIQGALWVGSPFLSPVWKTVRDGRGAGSPTWRPRFGNGSLVQAIDQFHDFESGLAEWGPIRMVFLQYASDPIVMFSYESAFKRPDWYKEDRAQDVSPDLLWVPVVTMLQTALDMTIAVQVQGFGHNYAPIDYMRAWHGLLEPETWTTQKSEDLADHLKARAAQ